MSCIDIDSAGRAAERDNNNNTHLMFQSDAIEIVWASRCQISEQVLLDLSATTDINQLNEDDVTLLGACWVGRRKDQ